MPLSKAIDQSLQDTIDEIWNDDKVGGDDILFPLVSKVKLTFDLSWILKL